MEQTTNTEVYDLLILVDATASMSHYLASLKQSLPQIISISALTNCFERIGVLAYRDYCDKQLLEWSGWKHSLDDKPDIVHSASCLEATGGGDRPEATKTGLARAYQLMRQEATTLILLYTDAPPHMIRGEDTGYQNGTLEQEALRRQQTCGEDGAAFADWVTAAEMLRNTSKRAHVLSILQQSLGGKERSLYQYLSQATGGAMIQLGSHQPRDISELTVEVILSWMGVGKEGVDSKPLSGTLFRALDDLPNDIKSEQDLERSRILDMSLDYVTVSRDSMNQHLPKKQTPLANFTETYKNDGKYRAVVTQQLREIIDRDVAAISLNPVFGSLWRVFSSDRDNEHRQELCDMFSRRIDSMPVGTTKTLLKQWLADSYDFTAEVLEMISSVPTSQRFPCVCLDPTLTFSKPGPTVAPESAQDQSSNALTRDELLEIGRSCDWKVLRRLGRVLTRLTFIESADAMPAHIAEASEQDIPRIPVALATQEHGRNFWRILLHIIVPGTMLSPRPSALLAALAIYLGIVPLQEAADQQMLFWRSKWNNIENPETWNVNCLSLLLDADKSYRRRKFGSESAGMTDGEGLLQDSDRALFERLAEYKLLERNLGTTLTARVAWTPHQTTMPIGPVVLCKRCGYFRSVTVMGEDNICGLCLAISNGAFPENYKDVRASRSDSEDSNAVWYECNVPACRGQYVVYNVEALNVRPKCHYCRAQGIDKAAPAAPFVECAKCLSRMIWPLEYQPSGMHDLKWDCVACRNGKATIEDTEVTANTLRAENGQEWLLQNKDQKLSEPFNDRTLYHVASKALPLDDLCDRVTIIPGRGDSALQLFMRGKLIRNTPGLLEELYSWIYRRRVQTGTCSLCFNSVRKDGLHRACGRSGCRQIICKDCLEGWYGLNAAGRIINTAAVNCPFCRRAPLAKILASYSMGIHAVGNLRNAIDHSGEWIYAWCRVCGCAKEYMERVCAAGAPQEIQDWACEHCCETLGDAGENTKPCPGCGIPTEKVGGCDHVHCRVRECNTHWCFNCGLKQDEDAIYRHMASAHGGYYGGLDEEPEEEEDED